MMGTMQPWPIVSVLVLLIGGLANASKEDFTIHRTALSIRFILLLLVLTVSVVENFTLMMLTLGRTLHRCRVRKERRNFQFSSVGPLSNRKFSEFATVDSNECDVPADFCANCGVQLRPLPRRQSTYHESPLPIAGNPGNNRLLCVQVKKEWLYAPNSACGRFTRYYFGNLCLANLMLSLFALPSTILASFGDGSQSAVLVEDDGHALLGNSISNRNCTLIEFTVTALAMAMIVCLVQLTFDRLLAICRPLHYDRIMTKRKALVFIILGWVFSIFMNSLPHIFAAFTPSSSEERAHELNETGISYESMFKCFYLGQHDQEEGHTRHVFAYFALVYVFPIVFMITSYMKLYTTAKRLSRAQNLKPVENNGHNDTKPQRDQPRNSRSGGLSMRMGETKATIRAFWLVLTFIALTIPYFTIMMVNPFYLQLRKNQTSEVPRPVPSSDNAEAEEQHDDLQETLRTVGVWLLYANATITPAIYALKDRVLRARFFSVFYSRAASSAIRDDDDMFDTSQQSKSQAIRMCGSCQVANRNGRFPS